MKSASFYAAFIVKKLWTLFAVVLVCVAVFLSVLRYSLPYLDEQKHQVETWLSEQYGVELAIGELSAGWQGNGPSLVLRDVELKQNQQSPIALNIQETQIEIDFWGSVAARQIQSKRFDLDGLILGVNLDQIRQSETDFPIVEALESLFLEQLQQFSVSDSIIQVTTTFDEQIIQVQHLSWVNREERHQGVGQMRVVELASNSASFVLDLYGDKDNLNGTFQATAEELDLSPWLNQLVKSENQLTESRGNFVFWAGIEQSRITGAQVELADSFFAWDTPERIISTSILGGELRAVPDVDGWKVNLEDLVMQTDGQSLITSWAGQIDRKGTSHFNSTQVLDIKALLPVLPLVLDMSTADFISRLDPSAKVNQMSVKIDEQFSAKLTFSDLGWNQVGDLPGTRSLSGNAYWHDDKGKISIQGVTGLLNINNILSKNIEYERLSLDAYLSIQDGLDLEIPELIFDSDVVSLTQSLSYNSRDNWLNIATDIQSMGFANVKRLLPTDLMSRDLYNYLSAALVEGNVAQAKVLWSGEPQSYPFVDNSGVFQASVSIQDATFQFDPQWPSLTELNIDLLFENESLYMDAQQGNLLGASIGSLEAAIPNLGRGAVLTIDLEANGTGESLTELLMASNIANSVGAALTKGVNVKSELSALLNLNIPLSGKNIVASGKVNLPQNDIYIPSLDLTFSGAKGAVSFVNDKVTLSQVQANLFGQAVSIDFDGADDGSGQYEGNVNLTGDWALEPILTKYQPGLLTQLNGDTSWQAHVGLFLRNDSYRYTVNLTSELKGIQSDLPVPFAKKTEDGLTLWISGEGDNSVSNFEATLGEQVQFTGILPHTDMQFSRAHLSIGESEIVGMGLGFSISADLEQLDAAAWYNAISLLVKDLPASEKPLLSAPQRVYVDAETVFIAGQQIDNLELVAKHSTEDWLLELNAEQARAEVMLYYDWLNKGINIQADFINLEEIKGDGTELSAYQQPDLANLPPVTFVCKQCKVQGKDLGRIDFNLSRGQGGMKIDSLRMDIGNGVLFASGEWNFEEQSSSTHLKGELNSSDFGALVKGFGFDAGIKDSKATFEFDVKWDKAPYAFNSESLNGQIDWRLTDGYISELTDKGARIFSIFSLQSLVRKLSLDFRDVFAKGFFYDKMDGSFQIADGRVNTEDTVIDGGAGEMTIVGYTDLPTQKLNYHIGFAPNVTSSLPLLMYFMVNPGTAIAALAIDQVLTEAKVISYVEYSLTGTIEEPIATPLDRRSEDISLPAKNTSPIPKPEESDQPPPAEELEERVILGIDSD